MCVCVRVCVCACVCVCVCVNKNNATGRLITNILSHTHPVLLGTLRCGVQLHDGVESVCVCVYMCVFYVFVCVCVLGGVRCVIKHTHTLTMQLDKKHKQILVGSAVYIKHTCTHKHTHTHKCDEHMHTQTHTYACVQCAAMSTPYCPLSGLQVHQQSSKSRSNLLFKDTHACKSKGHFRSL